MILYTVLEARLYEATIAKGLPYFCNTEKCNMLADDSATKQFRKAYDWLSNQMIQRICKPENPDIKYPVWAWYCLRGLQKRPDLRWREFRNYPEPMVLLEIFVDDNVVVLSNEEYWCFGPLNHMSILFEDEEWNAYDKLPVKEKPKYMYDTWQTIFLTENEDNIQATFWQLPPTAVQNVWYFNTNNKKSAD